LKINRYFKDIPVYVQSLYTERSFENEHKIKNKPLQFKKIIPIMQIKSLIISKSIFNPGFATFVQNLMLNDNPVETDSDIFTTVVSQYCLGCENKLVVKPFPAVFHFETFADVSRAIYKLSIEEYSKMVSTVD